MVKKRMDGYLLCFLTCATLSLVTSITLPYMVTNKPPRHTKYTSNATSVANGTKIVNVAATTATKGVVLYKVTASNGATCILLKVDGVIEVYFKSHAGQDQDDAYMLDDAAIEGNCKYEDTASMRIKWEGYTMIWNFAKTPGGKSFKLVHSQMLFITPVGKSYACEESVVDLTFPEEEYNPASLSARLFLRTFQLQPFMYKGSNFGPAFDCNAQLAFRDETAPIAVGSTLAIAVLATVTGYGVFRYFKIKKVQYNTME